MVDVSMFGRRLGARGVGLGALVVSLVLAFVSTVSMAQEKAIRFGASLSLSGRMSSEGNRVKDGYDFYAKLANERGGIKVDGVPHRVEIKYYDDESNAERAALLVERLILEDKVDFVLGPYSSGVTFAASTVAEKHRTPMIAAHAASTTIYERGYKYIFAVLNTVDQYTINIIKMAAERGAKSIALINENALFPQLGINGAAEQAADAGLQVVYKENYPTGTKDLSSMIAAAWSKSPDVIMAGGYTADMMLLARQAAEVGARPKMMGFLLGPTLPDFVKSLGRDAEYLLEPVQWAPNMSWKDDLFGITASQYADMFEKQFGYVPDYHPPQSTAALIVYHHAIEAANSLDPQKVRDAIAATDIMTMYGPIRFNEKGQNTAKNMGVIQIQEGVPVVVYPDQFKQADLIYPMPPR